MNFPARRRAATLVELLIGTVIAVLIVTLVISNTVRYQRSGDAIIAATDLRGRLRDAVDMISADLRASSPVGDSVLVASDTAIEFHSAIGSSVVCAILSSNRFTLPPDTLPSGRILSAWIVPPDTSDVFFLYADSSSGSVGRWHRATPVSVTSITAGAACPVGGLLSPSDLSASGRGYEITVGLPLPVLVRRGSPVRVVRRVRYSVYRGGDGKWYLGYRRCNGACAAIQPLSGPYETRSGPPLTFRYFTASGAPLVGRGPSAAVARVEIVARARYSRVQRFPGMAASVSEDSIVGVIALRNHL
ncbi:MAG: hypothetical protein M3R65_11290 [Gemmatimonadota bacterium]|nr:hypothetical protein [Gemmatimonadota bacterium]